MNCETMRLIIVNINKFQSWPINLGMSEGIFPAGLNNLAKTCV